MGGGTLSATACQSLQNTHTVCLSNGWKFIKGPDVRNVPRAAQQESVAYSECLPGKCTSKVGFFPSSPWCVDSVAVGMVQLCIWTTTSQKTSASCFVCARDCAQF